MRLPRLLTEPRNDGGVRIMCHCEERSDAAIYAGDCRSKRGRGKPLPCGETGSAGVVCRDKNTPPRCAARRCGWCAIYSNAYVTGPVKKGSYSSQDSASRSKAISRTSAGVSSTSSSVYSEILKIP